MNALVHRGRMLRSSLFGLSALLALSVFGCNDKPMTTQPMTPTPIPTQGPSTISMDVTLSRSDPPAGVKHAALATVVLRTGKQAVQVTRLTAGSEFSPAAIQVGVFTPLDLAKFQTATFTVTLTTNGDIPCSDGVDITVYTSDAYSDDVPTDRIVGCETVDWPF